ncbi:MAG: VIT domain-containing protein [Planctomycetota bacterium]
MRRPPPSRSSLLLLAGPLLLSLAPLASAQLTTSSYFDRASHVVMPQTSGFSLRHDQPEVTVERVVAGVKIVERAARTTLDVFLRNPGSRLAEAVLLLPVPNDAVVSEFLFEGSAPEATAELLPREEARRIYDEIVAKVRDPALLEFAGYNLIRSSLFPVPAGGVQRIRVSYEQVLEVEGNRIDYRLPRSESLDRRIPWNVTVDVRSKHPISMLYSPTHDLKTILKEQNHAVVTTREAAVSSPGAFLFSYLLEQGGVTASLLAYPDPTVGGGYFLLMAGLPAEASHKGTHVHREVTVVVDRSGSMAGEKMDQALAAVGQVLEGLQDGEAFNIIDYSSTISTFAGAPVTMNREEMLKAREYLKLLRPGGGTNIHDALLTALRQEPTAGTLPIVLFLTDGLPTIGRTLETDIRALVEKGNVHRRRVFTFGVGSDVNAPLLDRLAELSRATSTYVLEGEDVELKVAQVFRKLYGPVLSEPALTTLDGEQNPSTRMVRELMPTTLPDLFEGDELVLLGQYTSEEPISFSLSGDFLGTQRTFRFDFDFKHASVRNSFVPRLWAGRKIAFLIDQIRQAGGLTAGRPRSTGEVLAGDPRLRELTDEILRLSTKFGILTEYTAFLAREGTDLGDLAALQVACENLIDDRAVHERSGKGSVNQALNFNEQKKQVSLNPFNRYFDKDLNQVEFSSVQQVCDRAFFKRGTRWIDSRLVSGQPTPQVDEVIVFGSEAHRVLLDSFILQGRQGVLSLSGEILISYQNKNILIKND